MKERHANRQRKHPSGRGAWIGRGVRRLYTWLRRHGRCVPDRFLEGAAYQLGSGAVTLVLLWWGTRR
ncbi:hypothetical protein GCM10010448_30680 [Streptomyces glomeratus]|uniref:Uncharacterized protein n=1 Tax=Streptomyces glomeratus TaxID=284452 RepID=A0ABP6LK58_9ACTN